ncbi:hypothetical protein STEG23_016802, partial [Scotinomys teguina]
SPTLFPGSCDILIRTDSPGRDRGHIPDKCNFVVAKGIHNQDLHRPLKKNGTALHLTSCGCLLSPGHVFSLSNGLVQINYRNKAGTYSMALKSEQLWYQQLLCLSPLPILTQIGLGEIELKASYMVSKTYHIPGLRYHVLQYSILHGEFFH